MFRWLEDNAPTWVLNLAEILFLLFGGLCFTLACGIIAYGFVISAK